jgi:hypothetical protein
MGFFRKKTSSIADDAYKRAFEEEYINQSRLKGISDARKQAGRSKLGMMFDNFASNAKKNKGKSGWGLPTSDTLGKQFGSYASSKHGKKRKEDDFGF